jgi:glycerol-3-phosphate O-acyltransferase
VVDKESVIDTKTLIDSNLHSVVLVPTHKSFMDLITLSYVHYNFEVKCPFVCSAEALYHISIFRYLLNGGSDFKITSEDMKNELFTAVLKAYIEALMRHN